MPQSQNIWNEWQQAWQQKGVLIRLIIINIAVFVCLSILRFLFVRMGGMSLIAFSQYTTEWLILPASIKDLIFRPWTPLSYFFVHEGFFHILFNMLFLFWFGRLLQNYLGEDRLLHLYIGGGIIAGGVFILLFNLFPLPQNTLLLGASGAVYAVVVGIAVYVPNYVVYLFLFGPVRIKYIAIVQVFLSFYLMSKGVNLGGQMAHFGGALWGFLYVSRLKAGYDMGVPLNKFFETISQAFLTKKKTKIPKSQKSPTYKPKKDAMDTSDDELNTILDKISKSGYESLTKEEKEKLFRLSKK